MAAPPYFVVATGTRAARYRRGRTFILSVRAAAGAAGTNFLGFDFVAKLQECALRSLQSVSGASRTATGPRKRFVRGIFCLYSNYRRNQLL